MRWNFDALSQFRCVISPVAFLRPLTGDQLANDRDEWPSWKYQPESLSINRCITPYTMMMNPIEMQINEPTN